MSIVPKKDKEDARPPNSGKPLKLKITKVTTKVVAGLGESPNGEGDNILRYELMRRQ